MFCNLTLRSDYWALGPQMSPLPLALYWHSMFYHYNFHLHSCYCLWNYSNSNFLQLLSSLIILPFSFQCFIALAIACSVQSCCIGSYFLFLITIPFAFPCFNACTIIQIFCFMSLSYTTFFLIIATPIVIVMDAITMLVMIIVLVILSVSKSRV